MQAILNQQHPDIKHILRVNETHQEIKHDFIERYKKDNISKLTKDCEFVFMIKSFVGQWIEEDWKAVEYILFRQKELDGKLDKLESHKCLCGQCNLQNLCFIEHIPYGLIFKVGIECIQKISEKCYKDMLTLGKNRKMKLINDLIERQYQEIISNYTIELNKIKNNDKDNHKDKNNDNHNFSEQFAKLREFKQLAKNELFNSIPDKSNITLKTKYKEKLLQIVDKMFDSVFKEQNNHEKQLLKLEHEKLAEYVRYEITKIKDENNNEKSKSESDSLHKLVQLRLKVKEKFPLDTLLSEIDSAKNQIIDYWSELVSIDGYDTGSRVTIRQIIKEHHARWSSDTKKWFVQRRELEKVKMCCDVGEHICKLRKIQECKVCSTTLIGIHPYLCDSCKFVPFPVDSPYYMEIEKLLNHPEKNQIISRAQNRQSEKIWQNFIKAFDEIVKLK